MLELDPDESQTHLSLGEFYYDTGNLEQAEVHCRKALELDRDLTFAWLTLGNLCLDQERDKDALESFKKFLVLMQSWLAFHSTTILYMRQMKNSISIAFIEECLRRHQF